MELTLEALGITKEELQEKVVNRICAQVLTSTSFDEDGDPVECESSFHRGLVEKIKNHVDTTIGAIAEKSVLPNVTSYIENLCLQETNRWGEKTGKPVTFIEYLVGRADAYIREEVDYAGKSRAEDGGSFWKKHTTRISHLIHDHLKYNIDKAMVEAIGLANKSVKEALADAVKVALERVQVSVKTEVKSA